MTVERKREYKFNIRQFLTQRAENPVPMRVMVGWIEKETEKGIYVHLKAKPMVTKTCLRCGRTLTHPASIHYGIGPECGKHFHMHPWNGTGLLEAYIAELQKNLEDVTYEGWLPKSGVTFEPTGEWVDVEVQDKKQEPKKAEPTPQPVQQKAPEIPVDEQLVDALVAELKINL